MTPPDQVRSEVRLVAMERTEHGDFTFGGRVEVRTPEMTAAWDAGITEEEVNAGRVPLANNPPPGHLALIARLRSSFKDT